MSSSAPSSSMASMTPPDVVVGVLEEAGVDLHLAGEHRLERRPARPTRPGCPRGAAVSSVSGGTTPSAFWRARVSSRRTSQPASKRPRWRSDHSPRHVVRGVGGARREVDEEGAVGHQRLLLADPADGAVGQVLGQVVALLRGRRRLDRRRALVERRVVLVRLAAEEAVEVLEAAAAGRPGVEGAHRARLPGRHLVALAELRGGVAVQAQDAPPAARRTAGGPSCSRAPTWPAP